jgi:hypothetical protein
MAVLMVRFWRALILAAKGVYELVFHAGDYLRGAGETLPDPAFLDVIPIRFGIADTGRALPCAAADLGLWLPPIAAVDSQKRCALPRIVVRQCRRKTMIRKKRKPRGSTSVLTRLISKP